MADDLVDHFFEVDHFMEMRLKFKREMEAVIAPCIKANKDRKKKVKQPKITSFFCLPLRHVFCVVRSP
jgi:hypothetical protein